MTEQNRKIILGDQIATVLSSGTPDHDVAIVDTMLPAGAGAPRHVHYNHDESFYVLEGTVEVELDDTRGIVGPGGFLFAAKGHVHAFKNVGDGEARLLAVYGPARALAYLDELSAVLGADGGVTADAMADFYERFDSAAG